MKKTLTLFLFFVSGVCLGQNLVPNGSFELYDNCPGGPNQVYHCIGWSSASDSTLNNQTPDYWNVCSNTNYITPPNVNVGYQIPHSGSGYCGIGCYVLPIGGNHNVREYIQADLIDTLIPNIVYYVSFYANLSGALLYTYGTNKLGALFTTNKFVGPNFAMPLNFSQVYEDSVLTDTAGWYHFKGSFIADSNYRYMTIGNFFDDAHTDTTSINGNNALISYYYIDDVCVSTDSLTCYSPVGISENNNPSPISIYPNPFINLLNISLKNNQPSEITLYDITSRKLLQQSFTNSASINTQQLAPGIYFYVVSSKGKVIGKGKVVK